MTMTNAEKLPKGSKANTAGHNIAHGKAVLETEIAGLTALLGSVDDNFDRAVEAVHAMKQGKGARLIVAGIGKSGHVARKIAATLASTGTPSQFVHPGEASHGDMGMITEDDVVMMLSNSGENAELSDLIHYTRRFGITLIAMTSNPESTLAKHSDIPLILPKAPEACPNGMAPTTSTTMMIALGDAVAVALMHRMGLTKEEYKIFHPGGKLGQRLMKVTELMHAYDDLPLATMDATMNDVLLTMTEKNLGCVIITKNDTEIQGIITDGDLKRHMAPDLLTRTAAQIMSANPKTINTDSLAVEAMNVMTKTPGKYLTSLLVTDDKGHLKGLIRLQDCLQAGLA